MNKEKELQNMRRRAKRNLKDRKRRKKYLRLKRLPQKPAIKRTLLPKMVEPKIEIIKPKKSLWQKLKDFLTGKKES